MAINSYRGKTHGPFHSSIGRPLLVKRWGDVFPVHNMKMSWLLLSYLGLGADPVAGEGILPLWETQMGNKQAVVSCEGFGEEMPIQSSVQEPYLCVW